jgi:putative molybdenum carrier protein
MRIARIVSGGQTGVDLAALDAALASGVLCGGWVPRGRFNEDGLIAAHYPVKETRSAELAQRTQWNVRDSDATLILARGPLAGGSTLTERLAREQGKPCLHVDLAAVPSDAAPARILRWLATLDGTTLNVAGPRRSNDPEIYDIAYRVIAAVLRANTEP